MRLALTCFAAAVLLGPACAWAVEGELAHIDGVALQQIAARSFTLDREQEVTVDGVKLRRVQNRELMEAWILDAATRKPVWQLGHERESRVRTFTAHFRDNVRLPAGEYEAYLATFPLEMRSEDFWGWLWSFLHFEVGDPGEHTREVELSVRGEGRPGAVVTAESVKARLAAGAVVAFTCVGDNARLRQGFAVSAPLEVSLSAVGEVTGDFACDGARIVDTATRRTLWQLDRSTSERAGGASKNRRAEATLSLQPGRYVASYWSDDSHSCPHFNSAPPFDPFAWGLVVRAADPARRAALATFDYRDPIDSAVIVNLTRLGDDEHRTAGFTLKRPLEVLIHAVGEGRGNEMYDYGWIVDSRTRDTVWAMTYGATEPAGGAAKNREVDQVITLQAGSYVVHFVTDDSHSFADWNATPPNEPERWGITVAAASGALPANEVTPFDPARDPGALARIARVGNDAHERKRFQLDRETEVLVIAVGEGTREGMVDYGWITEAGSGRAVWKMEYAATEHAGGAAKNRLARARLKLPAGAYELHYESDDSHAYGRWNDAPPFDPDSWGIMVLPAQAPTVVEDPHQRR